MVMPAATAGSRVSANRGPWVSRPSPDMSITRRVPSKPLSAKRGAAAAISALIPVPPPVIKRGVLSIASAKARASSAAPSSVQSGAKRCAPGLDHWTTVTAIAPIRPARIAAITPSFRKAAAKPFICNANSR